MSGLARPIYVPHGASASWVQAIAKPEDGSAIDLTLVDEIEWLLLRTPTTAEADALLHFTLSDGVSRLDDASGLHRIDLTAAQCASLPAYGDMFCYTRLTFSDGSVMIPDNLRRYFLTHLASAEEQELADGCLTRLDAATGTLTPATPDMSNYILNRYDLEGLTGGTASDLDGLSASTLARLSDGTRLVLSLVHADGETSRAEYELAALDGDTEVVPWVIVCDRAATRAWRLDRGSIHKGSLPCTFNVDSGKFHKVWGVGADGGAVVSLDPTGFTLPA